MNITADQYHADSNPVSLSSSIIYTLITKSPWHARREHPRLNPEFKREEDDKFNVGIAAHALLLEGQDRIAELDFDSWRTQAARDAKQAGRAAGKLPMLGEQAVRVRALVKEAERQIAGSKIATAWALAQSEVTIHWEQDGAKARARLDKLHQGAGFVFDYKTTDASAQPDAWIRSQLFSMGYDIQAAWYLMGSGVKEFIFCVQETDGGAMSFVALGPEVLENARRKIDIAVRLWNACMAANSWPAYPTQVCWADAQPWHASAIESLEFWADDVIKGLKA